MAVDHPELVARLSAEAEREERQRALMVARPPSVRVEGHSREAGVAARLPAATSVTVPSRESRVILMEACDYRAPLPDLSEVDPWTLPLERCGCQTEIPHICLAGISPYPGRPSVARTYDCLKCISKT
jgi:hypothetical protein